LQVGSATDAMMMGTTYRTAQQTMHSTMSSVLGGISAALTAVGVALEATPAAAAGPSVKALVPLIISLGNAITSFESQSARYLSQKNSSD
jgi:hypothetical protein